MDKELASVIDAAGIRPALRSYWRIRNELTPSIPHLIDPRYLFLSSESEMQAVGMKNHNSLHSI